MKLTNSTAEISVQSPIWRLSEDPVPYPEAVSWMESRVDDIRHQREKETIWLLEHPSLYTAGTSAKSADLVSSDFPVYQTGRGGQYTYHGPGQRVAYVMLDLKRRQKAPDLKRYIYMLEQWVIDSLAMFDIYGERRDGRVGIWVVDPKDGAEKKIAAIGVRVRHWISYHGVAINLNPDLSHFSGIVPCGIRQYGVTSLHDLGQTHITYQALDQALQENFYI